MGWSKESQPIEVLVHDDAVIVTGLGENDLVLSANAAERLASKLSGAAFAASRHASANPVEDREAIRVRAVKPGREKAAEFPAEVRSVAPRRA